MDIVADDIDEGIICDGQELFVLNLAGVIVQEEIEVDSKLPEHQV